LKKTRPLKIYLGDLTYTTVTLATEAFPLNVGYIASYCKKLFGNDVEITLFKYIDEIDKAVNENPPDILGLSNYCWSHNVSYEIFKMCKKTNPNVVTIWGGPNFPIDFPSQKKFMEHYKEVDIYVPVDGEKEKVFDENLYDTYTQASWKPFIVESIIFLQKIANAPEKLEQMVKNAKMRLEV
jgi:predicted MPP superfamily phosphohydrolase